MAFLDAKKTRAQQSALKQRSATISQTVIESANVYQVGLVKIVIKTSLFVKTILATEVSAQ